MLTPLFVILWVGNEYVMDTMTLLLMTVTLFIQLNRTTVDAYINAYGLFGDIFAPVTEASINICLSVLLGYFWGLNGVLLGVLISLFLVVFCWKPYYLFRKALKQRLKLYIIMYVKHLSVAIVSIILIYSVLKFVPMHSFESALSSFVCPSCRRSSHPKTRPRHHGSSMSCGFVRCRAFPALSLLH